MLQSIWKIKKQYIPFILNLKRQYRILVVIRIFVAESLAWLGMASYFDEHELTDRTSNPDFFLELARMLLSPSDILEISRMAFDQIQAPPASKEAVESLPSIPITTEHVESRLFRLFTQVPISPDNRGSTVIVSLIDFSMGGEKVFVFLR
ncbi:E3 ubiquitin-protein ligase RNF181 [Stylophora pistillata]|uniref:E3 ubiquitin-protein ligase RNF181 n=1 Tax=Stylophora pistillata TaxID=50429 RepID=A0A2B4RM06_STYPI|nr:E3 ubiquitin-protein ligase RNF181 [Stylophora pistillata]